MGWVELNTGRVLEKSRAVVLLSIEARPCQPEGTADPNAGSQAVGVQPGCCLQDAAEEEPPKWGSERPHPTGQARTAQGLEGGTPGLL